MGNEVMCLVKKIPLTQGQFALVDDEDFDFLNQWNWSLDAQKNRGTPYARRRETIHGKETYISMHRFIMSPPREMEIDHINGDGLDNRRTNLRIVSHRQNMQNMKVKGTSKYPGVCWNKKQGKWRAKITVKGIEKHIGSFDDEYVAGKAYANALYELTGEKLICELE